jgi:hypothetical protein
MYRKSAVASKRGKTSFANKFFRIAATTAATAGLLLLAACPGDDEGETPVGPTTKAAIDTGWYTKNPEATIFNISTAAQLAGLAELVNGGKTFADKTVNLSKDISLSAYGSNYREGMGWVPIGRSKDRSFRGTFDGDGHVVSGLYISDNNLDWAGLFGCVRDGVVKNIGVVDVNIRAASNVGGLIGYRSNSNTINCYTTGTVKGVGDNVGGVVGREDYYGRIGYCYSSCSVSGRNYVGGILGSSSCATEITMCYSIGAIQGNDQIGGIVANASGGCAGGGVSYSAALNPSVKVLTGTSVARININDRTPGSFNVAFSGITNNAGTTDWDKKGADKQDGADITFAQIIADGTLGARFTEDWGWTVQDGKLPGLFGKTVDIPDHLKQ